MAQFVKFKFLVILKFNFNGGQFSKKILKMVISKNCKFSILITFEIENGEYLR